MTESFDDEIIALLAEEAAAAPPPLLRSGVLARAMAGRAPGRPVNAARPCEPSVSFDRTVADTDRLLRSLSAADWEADAHAEHGRVRDLVAHLVGVERLALRWLEAEEPAPESPDHIAATGPVVAELVGAAPDDLIRQWHDGARAVAGAAQVGGYDGTRMVTFHDLTISVDQLLMVRTGELWAHGIDICQATGRELPRLDPERLSTLCTTLVEAVPLALAYQGTMAPGRAARLVLTGPAGGTFTVPLAPFEEPAEPEVTIIADAVDVCQLALRRLRPDQLDAAFDGDRALGDFVLEGMDALARD